MGFTSFVLVLLTSFFLHIVCDDDFKKTVLILPAGYYEHQVKKPCYVDNWTFESLNNELKVFILLNSEITNSTRPPKSYQEEYRLENGKVKNVHYSPKQTDYWIFALNDGVKDVTFKFTYQCNEGIVIGAIVGISVGGAVLVCCVLFYVCLAGCTCCLAFCFLCNCCMNLMGYIPSDESEKTETKGLLGSGDATSNVESENLLGYYQNVDQFTRSIPRTSIQGKKEETKEGHIKVSKQDETKFKISDE